METEHAREEVLNNTKPASVWNTVTPLSKYLAMALFVALPFIGGWIGYTLAPEKVVVIEKVVEIEKETQEIERQTSNVDNARLTLAEICARDSNSIRESNGDYILRAEPSSWETQYDIIVKINDSERRGMLCKYNKTSGGYELLLDLTDIDDNLMPLEIIKLFDELPVSENIYLTTSLHEGLQYAPLLKIDVTEDQPTLVDTGFDVPNHPGFVTSLNREKMILFQRDAKDALYLFDIRTGKSKLIHEIDSTNYTYFNKDGYSEPLYRVEWLDDERVRIRAVSVDKNDLTEAIFANAGGELSYDELARTGDLIEEIVDVSKYSF